MQTTVNKELFKEAKDYSQIIIKGLNASPSHFHAVTYCQKLLRENGFTELKEVDRWPLKASTGYFFTRNGSTLVAFLTGAQCGVNKEDLLHSFKIVGCHTDSPCLKLAPVSKLNAYGYCELNVLTYGGGLWRTWMDRDLTVAGKVIV